MGNNGWQALVPHGRFNQLVHDKRAKVSADVRPHDGILYVHVKSEHKHTTLAFVEGNLTVAGVGGTRKEAVNDAHRQLVLRGVYDS